MVLSFDTEPIQEYYSFELAQAAAIAFVRYHREINSMELVKRLIRKSAFVLPGDLFGLDHFLRISFGLPGRRADTHQPGSHHNE